MLNQPTLVAPGQTVRGYLAFDADVHSPAELRVFLAHAERLSVRLGDLEIR